VAYFKVSVQSCIRLEGLRRGTEITNQEIWGLRSEANHEDPEVKPATLSIQLMCLFLKCSLSLKNNS
jgi:hypothetical protein